MSKTIDQIDTALLKLAAPETPAGDLAGWVEPIKAACRRFEINSIRRVSAFIGQMAHESGLRARSENLNYRASRLAEVWPSRFSATGKKGGPPNALAKKLAHNPEALANHVYANRMGNAGPETGDGWANRGVGPLQVTGYLNLSRFAQAMGMPLQQAREWARTTIEGGVMSAAWFWEDNDINRLADTPGVEDESRKINGGSNGLADRRARFDRLVAELLRRERAGIDQ